jgi:pyridoxine 5'-phosphate synthase PdxJ
MVKLSVNINKIATIRNARGSNNPNLISMAKDIQSFGASTSSWGIIWPFHLSHLI